MTRLTSIASTLTALALATATPALAQGQAELASKLNDEGKELMYSGKYAEAAAKFRDASARVPDAKYFFNLCTANFQQGRFDEAITACNAAENHSPTPDLLDKVGKLSQRIKDEAKAQNIELRPTGGGGGNPDLPPDPIDPNDPNNPPPDPGNPNGNPPPNYQPAVGRPPSQGLFTGTTPDNNYTWTLGVDLFGGGGRVGEEGFYGTSSGGIRVKGDYLLNAATRIGAQAYFQLSHFGTGEMDSQFAQTLDIFDLGIAAYKHFCLAGTQRLCVTPLAGVQLALMSPAGDNDGYGSQVFNYSALGARLEVGAHYAFGRRFEHVLGVAVGTNVYSAVFSESEDAFFSADMVGLDTGGAAGYVSLGYTYRFNTPLGSSPFVTLE